MVKVEKIWDLSKCRRSSLKRAYGWWNALFIAFLVSLILQMINLFRQMLITQKLSILIFEFVATSVIVMFIMIFVSERSKHEIALEVQEKKLKKQKALHYIAEMYHAF